MTLAALNSLPEDQARQALERCCGASRWVDQMVKMRPYGSAESLSLWSEKIWRACSPDDWREAFLHHPKIGDAKSLEKKFSAASGWAGDEQGSVGAAAHTTLESLATLNAAYEKKFGYIFIVFATGKTAEEMLALLQSRIKNNPESEIMNAMEEQNKITKLRLKKLVS